MLRENLHRILISLLFAGTISLAGCADDGNDGAQGPPGPSGTAVVDVSTQSPEGLAALNMTGEITSVTIASPPVVQFRVTNESGQGVVGLGDRGTTSLTYARFNVVKLVPGVNGSPSTWVSYIGPNAATPGRPTTENTGTMVDNGDGSYTYTFVNNITLATNAVTYEPARTHRLAIQISGGGLNPLNMTHDFVPNGGAVSVQREIVTTAACNECHDKFTFHGGGRQDTRYCVTCHTSQRSIGRTSYTSVGGVIPPRPSPTVGVYVVDGEVFGDFMTMVHKIHMGINLTKTGYDYAGVLFNEIGYPQSPANCRKCHNGAEAAQGDNWKSVPSRAACGACHDNVNFVTGAGHPTTDAADAIQLNDGACIGCHDATKIEGYHLSENATANNPDVPAGAVNFTYVLDSVTVNASNQPVIKFQILADGTPVVFTGAGTTAAGTPPADAVLTGFSGSPSFLLAYALPNDGLITDPIPTTFNPVDYNNRGKSAAQPATVSIAYLLAAANGRGTITGPDQGLYTATITDVAYGFPVGAKLRAVGLQGYFTQVAPAVARHTISVVKNVATDAERRTVVDSVKCGNCHEWFEAHGGNRVYNIQICATCHVPNLSTSGKGANPANINPANQALLTAAGYDPTAPAGFPEETNNLKDLIHGIHASHIRTTEYEFVRDRGTSGVYYYNWSHVLYPSAANNCEKCHIAGTYDIDLPVGALPTTVLTTDRANVPNANDMVISPAASACVYCHDSDLAKSHMAQNGGMFDARSVVAADAAETCVLCHGPGRSADVVEMHK